MRPSLEDWDESYVQQLAAPGVVEDFDLEKKDSSWLPTTQKAKDELASHAAFHDPTKIVQTSPNDDPERGQTPNGDMLDSCGPGRDGRECTLCQWPGSYSLSLARLVECSGDG